MTKLKISGAICLAIFLAMLVAVQPAAAQDAEKNMRLVTMITLDPASEEKWDTGWADIVKMADKHNYPYTEIVVAYQNKRWILTPISNYADLDAVEAARDEVAEAAGSRFDRAIAKMQAAEMNSQRTVHKYDPELSYSHPDAGNGVYGKIDTIRYRPGKSGELKKLVGDYKKLSTDVGTPGAYDVYWGMLGNEGNVMTVVSTADNPLALAQNEAAGQKLMNEKKKEEVDKLFDDFRKITLGSTTDYSYLKPDWSMNLPEE